MPTTSSGRRGVTVLGLAEGGVDWAQDDNNKPLITADMRAAVEKGLGGYQGRHVKVHDYMSDQKCRFNNRGGRSGSPAMSNPAIRLVGIEKRFGAVHANRSVDSWSRTAPSMALSARTAPGNRR